MSLNKDTMGTARKTAMAHFNNRTMSDLINEYGTLDAIREAAMRADSDAIITHFKTQGTVPALGLTAPAGGGPVTGTAGIQ